MTSGVEFTPHEVVTKKARMLEWLLNSTHGNFTNAAEFVGISRGTVYQWLEADPQFAIDMKKARAKGSESGIDFVEGKLMDAIKEGNVTAMIFFLKCMGKDRGWIDRVMMSFDKENPLNLTVTHDATREFRQMLSALAAGKTGSGPVTIEMAQPSATQSGDADGELARLVDNGGTRLGQDPNGS